MWWLYLIVFVVGVFFGIAFILTKVPPIGTLYIDMDSKEDKDIARIVFDRSLEEIAKYGLMTVKIEKKSGLSSFDGKL